MLGSLLLHDGFRGMDVGPLVHHSVWSCVNVGFTYSSSKCSSVHSATSPATEGHDCSGTCIITLRPSDEIHVFDPHERHLLQRQLIPLRCTEYCVLPIQCVSCGPLGLWHRLGRANADMASWHHYCHGIVLL